MPKPVAKKAKAGRPRLPRPHGEVCSVPGCGRPLNVGYGGTRKYCPLHYQRHRRGKSMNPEPERARDLGDLVLLSVRVSKGLGDQMKKLARHTGRSISALAREALEEMRLSVRGLTGKPVKLIDALGDWRAEVVSRLTQSGVQGDWHSPSDEEVPHTLSSRAYVQTTRILREAVSNIIKHSGASQCSVRCTIAKGDFQLVIQDNGKGIPMELDGRLDKGHGMASMKGRAKQLQGQCLVESGPGYGTVIRLTLPLERHTTGA